MIEIKRRPNESIEDALRRFRRKVRKSGLMQELRRSGEYEKPSERRRRKQRLARKREDEREDETETHTTPRYARH